MKWATRAGVHVDRAATAWLIRRVIDQEAEFVFVEDPDEVPADATPFDMLGVALSHRGDMVTFETVLTDFDIDDPAMTEIGRIVHEADVADDLYDEPEAAGLDTVIRGLSMAETDEVVEHSCHANSHRGQCTVSLGSLHFGEIRPGGVSDLRRTDSAAHPRLGSNARINHNWTGTKGDELLRQIRVLSALCIESANESDAKHQLTMFSLVESHRSTSQKMSPPASATRRFTVSTSAAPTESPSLEATSDAARKSGIMAT